VRGGAETGAYTLLSPRQKVNPTPYSQYSYNSGALGGQTADYFWKKGGNAGATQNILGTTENYSLDIITNNARVVKFQPHATSPSIIGGSASNSGEYKYTAARTFVKQLPVGMFHTVFDYHANLYFDEGAIITYDINGSKEFYFIPVPLELPDGAVVTELKLYYHDNSNVDWFNHLDSNDFALIRRGVLQASEAVMAAG
jgi:hypothetical protein